MHISQQEWGVSERWAKWNNKKFGKTSNESWSTHERYFEDQYPTKWKYQ